MKRFYLLLLVVTAATILGCWWFLRSSPFDEAMQARAGATRVLGAYLADHFAGQQALVISNPFTQDKGTPERIVATEAAGIRGLREGLGRQATLQTVAYPELKPGARENPRDLIAGKDASTPLSYLVQPDAFDTLAATHPECELIVSLIGLPAELGQVRCWQTPDPPAFALLLPDLRIIGDAHAVRQAMQSGKLAAFVLNKPGGAALPPTAGDDWRQRFDAQFLLVTAENLDEVIKNHPELFRGF